LDSDLHCSLQILINNAGILATSPRATAEGYDQLYNFLYISFDSIEEVSLYH